ncbi:MFS transporter [Xenorhabdus sp. KJ12.1]|uniref:MFS transporter n=1 Tax=Xenorhabdus sp. KJ12.1 TaxID=1851571 RepID=UPI000C041459|nr:MFS transporter [Xenorhabdus sp. KJ12.1]PHM67141.1 multidrug transporter [Xenorhabdus sp. KJ12.1]
MSSIRMLSIFGIYLVIFIDNMGASLIIPMLTPITHDPISGLIVSGSEHFRNAIYGVSLGLFSMTMLFGAPLLGALSDSQGRKKILIYCLMGLFLSYILLALALTLKSIILFIIGRIIGGFFSGSVPVAQAAIIDITNEKDRAKYIGYIMFFVSLGYVAGPLIGGYLSSSELNSIFNLMTPFIFVAVLSAINVLILVLVFKDKKSSNIDKSKTQISNPINSIMLSIKAPGIRYTSLVLLLMLMGWNTFFQFIGLSLTRRLEFSQYEVSNYVSWIGIGLAFAFLFLIGFVMKYIRPKSMITLALVLMTICIAGSLAPSVNAFLYLLAFVGAIGFGLAYSGLIAQLLQCVDAANFGATMGMAAAIAAFSAGFSGIVFGFVAGFNIVAPMYSALAFIVVALLLSSTKENQQVSTTP